MIKCCLDVVCDHYHIGLRLRIEMPDYSYRYNRLIVANIILKGCDIYVKGCYRVATRLEIKASDEYLRRIDKGCKDLIELRLTKVLLVGDDRGRLFATDPMTFQTFYIAKVSRKIDPFLGLSLQGIVNDQTIVTVNNMIIRMAQEWIVKNELIAQQIRSSAINADSSASQSDKK